MNARPKPPPAPETATDPHGGGTGIGEAEVLYVDSRAGIEEAVRQGLRPDAEVRSSSPALVLDSTLDVTQADAHILPTDLLEFWCALNESSRETFLRLRTELDSEALALVVARTLFLSQNLLQKAMTLQEDDFHRPVAVTVHEPSPVDALGRLNGPWPELLSSNPRLVRITVPESRTRISYPLYPLNAGFLSRILFADWQTIGYRLLLSLWDRLPGSSPKGCILIPNEGSLVKETAFRLAMRGFALKSLSPPRDRNGGTNRVDPSLVVHVRGLVSDVIAPGIANKLAPSALAAVKRILEARIVGNMESYQGALADWCEELDSLSADRPKAILCNNNMHPEMIALNEAAEERRIPFVMFEHGAARAFTKGGTRNEVMYETANADILFTYTPVAADIVNKSPVTRGRAISVGAPRDYYRIRKRRGSANNAPPIWYVSTLVYHANMQGFIEGMTDAGLARYEIDVIDRVLAKLPHSVLYKPYPTTRYAMDPDPVSERARSTDNVTYYGEALDLRYLPDSARVLVTSRAGSTQDWCMALRKPLVHVLFPGEPLTEEARPAFKESIFVFDGRSPRMHDELVDFLSQPIAEIERLWERRAPARRELISRFFDCGHADAGTRAANLLVESGFDPARIP